jgi:hypothetical protein
MAPDPYYYDVFSPLRIKFYSYGLPLNEKGVLNVIHAARSDIETHDIEAPINQSEITFRDWKYRLVELALRPQRQVTWLQWEATTLAMHFFIEAYDTVEMKFDVEIDGSLALGTGTLIRGVGVAGW